jgi:hypothetical protein
MSDFKKTFQYKFKMRENVEKFTPESEKTKIENEKLSSIRLWLIFLTVMWLAKLIIDINNKIYPLPVWLLIVSVILTSIMLICILLSKFKYGNAIYIGMITLQIRNLVEIFSRVDILSSRDP